MNSFSFSSASPCTVIDTPFPYNSYQYSFLFLVPLNTYSFPLTAPCSSFLFLLVASYQCLRNLYSFFSCLVNESGLFSLSLINTRYLLQFIHCFHSGGSHTHSSPLLL
jgi:hypothetical protein